MKLRNDLIFGEDGEKGFTLIELLIALVIFSIGIVGAARLQIAAISGNAYSMQLTQAISVAQNQAERLQDINFTVAGVTDGVRDALETPGTTTTTGAVVTINNTSYTPIWTAVSVNNNPRLREVRMIVNWNEKGVPRSYILRFYTGMD
jgi:prepilin-type N-terminal cleavage/methylation domain-containing protein